MMSLLSDTIELKKRFPSWLLPAFGYAVSAISLVWVLRQTPLRESADHLRHLSWIWVALALVFELGANLAHAWRWRLILSPAADAPFWRCAQSVLIGLFANEVLPAKAGEVIRAYLLTHWTKVHLPLSFTSVVIEGVIDGIWLVVIYFMATVGVSNLPHLLVRGAWVLGLAVSLLSILFLYLLFHKQHSHEVISKHKWASQFLHFLDELHSMGQARTLLAGFGVSFLYIFFQILSIWALLHADQYDFDIQQAALIVVVFRIGTVVPNAPGNVGALQFFTTLGVLLAGGERGSASAFGEVNFVFITLARLVEGGIAILLTGVNLSDIHRHAHRAHETRMRPRRVG
jgi:glycosyltransferase 2 family protein